MRLPLTLLVICLVVAGCAAPPREERPVDGLVAVFADGFHSGIILERREVPVRLLPESGSTPWVAVHFGERRWISGEADGVVDALRLVVWPGDGGVQVDAIPWLVHDRGGTDREHERIWLFTASRAELDGLRARLDSWVDRSAMREPLRVGSCWWPARHEWSLRTNCHDFTADLLAGAGILVARPPLMLAGPLRAALDLAWSDRDSGR